MDTPTLDIIATRIIQRDRIWSRLSMTEYPHPKLLAEETRITNAMYAEIADAADRTGEPMDSIISAARDRVNVVQTYLTKAQRAGA